MVGNIKKDGPINGPMWRTVLVTTVVLVHWAPSSTASSKVRRFDAWQPSALYKLGKVVLRDVGNNVILVKGNVPVPTSHLLPLSTC